MPPHKISLALSILVLLRIATAPLSAQLPAPDASSQGLNGLKEVPFTSLSSSNVTLLGQAALSIRPNEWKHAETDNFVYHYFHSFIATPVSVEAEFYYRVIARDLNKDTSRWERKAHIFVFEQPEDWNMFRTKARLDPWTGGIHANGELFIQRDPSFKFKGSTLGHETAHLVLDRFYGSNVPLWLNEGYAEYISHVAYASFNRARGYDAHPHSNTLTADAFVPLDALTNALTYPAEVKDVRPFYYESEKLVRFLNAADKTKFQLLLDALAKGSRFESALRAAYGFQFASTPQLEQLFKPYAIQPPTVAGAAGSTVMNQ